MQGYIKLHRQITEWEWYSNINVCRLFIHCLLKANHKNNKWQGITIEQGSFITSIENLAFETGLSVQQIRTALNKLKLTGEITSKTTSKYSIISIKNWKSYQLDNTQDNKQITNNQQTNNKQITTNNNDNNENNDKNEKKYIDLYINEHKSFFESEYKRIFKAKPFLSKNDLYKIIELSELYDKEIITEALVKLKNISFEDINFKPSASWLLKDNNFERVMNGEFNIKEPEVDEVDRKGEIIRKLEEKARKAGKI